MGVLQSLIARPVPNVDITLVNDGPHLRYSGMVPGIISGRYASDAGQVDLAPLCQCAGARFIDARVASLDPDRSVAHLKSGEQLAFDVASIATGGVGRAEKVFGQAAGVIDIRPIDRFVHGWDALVRSGAHPRSVLVIGGGAGGVEIAFALRHANPTQESRIDLVTGQGGLLPNFSSSARRIAASAMRGNNIVVHEANARYSQGGWFAVDEALGEPDLVIAAIGSGAPDWPRASGLATDAEGFISVDGFQRSISHQHIFATGDVAQRQDRTVDHSGVHAVHAGKILAHNLRAAVSSDAEMRRYRPRRASLYLLSTGAGWAIGTYGPLAVDGHWVGWLKRRIDEGWVNGFAQIAEQCNRKRGGSELG